MSTFSVLVRTIDDVFDHPNADRLSIIRILGYEAISAKNEDGTHRFVKGEPVVYVPEAAVVPEDVLKERGFWNEEKGMGLLAGKKGDRVKAIRLRGVLSQGLVFKVERLGVSDLIPSGLIITRTTFEKGGYHHVAEPVEVGQDVADFFGITKYEPPVPVGMGGEVASVYEFAMEFDIENEQNFPGFLEADEVEATEKLHGTCTRISFRPNVTHPEMFGKGGVAICSKGLGSKGLVFKNNEANVNNLYVRTLVALDLVNKIEALGEELGVKIDLFGEIFGRGVQDLHYGLAAPEFRAFDIAIDGVFADSETKVALFERLGVERVPVLYRGPWDRDALVAVRDGKTTLGEGNIREGIVVTAVGDQTKREYMNHRLRPFLKMVSPDYLTRKGEITEFQ